MVGGLATLSLLSLLPCNGKFSVLLQEDSCSVIGSQRVLTRSPKISDLTKKEFFQNNLVQEDEKSRMKVPSYKSKPILTDV